MIKILPACAQACAKVAVASSLVSHDGLAAGKRRPQIVAEVNLRRYLNLRIGGGACDYRLTHATSRTVDKQLERTHRKSMRV
jgi:hypothetical protein